MSRTILSVSRLTTMSPFLNDVSGPTYQALTWHLKLARHQSTSNWMRLFNADGDFFQIIYDFVVIHVSKTTPFCCNSYGSDAVRTCFTRRMVEQMLTAKCISFWDSPAEISRESYYETIELILLFLHGIGEGVVRPLPALTALGKHRFLNGYFEQCSQHSQRACEEHEYDDCAEDDGLD